MDGQAITTDDWEKVALRIKYENVALSFMNAYRHIVETNIPHLVLEDDIVLATSKAEVRSYLEEASDSGNRTFFAGGRLQSRIFPRRDFDIVPLGSCGYGTKFACEHAKWVTPAGAKAFLEMAPQCPAPTGSLPKLEDPVHHWQPMDIRFC